MNNQEAIPMPPPANGANGFSIIELVVSSSLLLLAVTMTMVGYTHMLRQINVQEVQNELDIQVQTTMERLNYSMRLSALNKMFFSPAGEGAATAVSFPMARDDDGDGAIDVDADNAVIWDGTVVYHIWPGSPHQLRQTIFDPRDNTLSDVERQAQLEAVIAAGSGTGTYNGQNATTITIFENLFEWHIDPRGAIFDAYAPIQARAANVRLGSCVLAGGAHEVRFTVLGRQASSTGYKIGVDSLMASPSYSQREGERLLPSLNQLGGPVDYAYMAGGAWSGNYQALFPAANVGDYFTFTIESDLWEEGNFQTSGDTHDNTVVLFDTSTDPGEFVVVMEGLGTNWSAALQTGDDVGYTTDGALAAGAALRVLLRGEEMISGNWIQWDGGRFRLRWRAGQGSDLTIAAAYLAEANSSASNTMDTVAGTPCALSFDTSSSGTIPADGDLWSDYIDYPIEREKSYLVSYRLAATPAGGRLMARREVVSPGLASTFVIPAASIPTDADLVADIWSSRGDVLSSNAVIGVDALVTSLAPTGTYISAIFDTHCAAPAYSELNWDAVVPEGCSINVKVRTAVNPDMSDAPVWDAISFIPNYGMIDPGNKQYVQFLAQLRPDSAMLATPKLKSFIIKWSGEEKVVAIGGSFTKGPDYGIFQVSVDGQEVVTGLTVDLSIFKDVRAHGAQRRLTSNATVEVHPRNTGL